MLTETNPMKEFFERIGQRTFKTESTWWHEVQHSVVLSFPYHNLINPSDEEVNELMAKYKLKVLRFPAPIDTFGFVSTLELNPDTPYSLQSLHSTARRQTKQGLNNCQVMQIGFDLLEKEGLELSRATSARQGRDTIYDDKDYWDRYCKAAKDTEGAVAWAAIVDGKLASYVFGIEWGGWLNTLLTNSSSELLDKRPNNAVLYEMTRIYLQEKNMRICYGIGSLEDVSNLDRFKVKMGWNLKPIKQRLVFAAPYHLTFSYVPGFALNFLNKLFPKNYTVRKTTSMIRLYRQQTTEVPDTCNLHTDNEQ